jgi:hypothetical protein
MNKNWLGWEITEEYGNHIIATTYKDGYNYTLRANGNSRNEAIDNIFNKISNFRYPKLYSDGTYAIVYSIS